MVVVIIIVVVTLITAANANNSGYDYCHEDDGGDRRTLEMHNDTLWRDPGIADRYLP